jgi:DNA-binding NtrC family response regulator
MTGACAQDAAARTPPWLHFWGAMDASVQESVVEGLAGAGLAFRPLDRDVPQGGGVLCFSDFDTDLFDFLRDVGRDSSERVLAIPVSDAAVSRGQVWELLRAGASDVLAWSLGCEVADRVKARFERWRIVDALMDDLAVRTRLVGTSAVWRTLLRQIVEIARFTDAPILLIGESGTGKELIAHMVRELDSRNPGKDLVVVDCGTIVPELSGSEFFGHERGAFTGAVSGREGAFALADKGTLFLDEVGELPMMLQAQLLRVVQERTYKRVGGNVWHRTEFRLVCATNKDLLRATERGEFRQDLYYRIAGWVFRVPSLGERRGDIMPLAHHFLSATRPDIAPWSCGPSASRRCWM